METEERLHGLDAVRAFAMLGGILLHAMVSFVPGGLLGWPVVDVSTSVVLREGFFVLHMCRMSLFFVMAGLFARLLYHRLGAIGFLRNRLKRIAAPLLVAMIIVLPLVIAAIVFGMRRMHVPPPVPPVRPLGIPVPFVHLWFLYLLCWFYATLLLIKGAVKIVPGLEAGLGRVSDAITARAVRLHVAVPLLALPLVVSQMRDRYWILFEGVPTPAVGLVPNTPALIAYGTAFAFGWLLHRQIGLIDHWRRHWGVYLTTALVLTLAARLQLGLDPSFVLVPVSRIQRLAYACCYSMALWCWTLGLIGLAQRYCAEPSPRVRYLADASYWMYLVHLPMVWGLAALVAPWPLHWTVKFGFILLVSVPMLLASYRFIVRGTFIGALLNGRRRPARAEARNSAM
ncbi:MAG: acyltransferase family protein [Sphingobium sp.]|nr:acyltransferase family protein [Sphingobium sp.]